MNIKIVQFCGKDKEDSFPYFFDLFPHINNVEVQNITEEIAFDLFECLPTIECIFAKESGNSFFNHIPAKATDAVLNSNHHLDDLFPRFHFTQEGSPLTTQDIYYYLISRNFYSHATTNRFIQNINCNYHQCCDAITAFLSQSLDDEKPTDYKALVQAFETNYKDLCLLLTSPDAFLFVKNIKKLISPEMLTSFYRLVVAVRMRFGLSWADVLCAVSSDQAAALEDEVQTLFPLFLQRYLPKSEIVQALQNDDLECLQDYCALNPQKASSFSFPIHLNREVHSLSFAHFGALSGALNCFKYIILNQQNYPFGFGSDNLLMIVCAFLGGNLEIITMLTGNMPGFDELIKNNKEILSNILHFTFKKDLLDWIETNF